jgi:outer membrane protein OmpA-like peptidoglycan-associated protein
VLSQPAPPDAEQLLVVKDATASVADMPLPAKLTADIVEVSKRGGVITVIAVDGLGVQPRIVAKRAALSTPGPRDRPSVTELAAAMPRCVTEVLLDPVRPTKPGTDLYQAMSLSRDLMIGTTRLWTLTDLFANAGQLNLGRGELLRMEPDKAASILGRAAPLNLDGVVWQLSGVANTTARLSPTSRSWMIDFAQSLCTAWRATGCASIQLDPVNPDRSLAESLPKDATLHFPEVEEVTSGDGCTFTLPSAVAFDSESDELRDGRELLAKPITLMQAQPLATAKIVGHTASVSRTAGTGKRLSRRRAVAVKSVLVEAGIDPKRISVKGVGDTQPLGEDIDLKTGKQIEEKAAKERRVTVSIKGVPCSG